MSNTYEQLMARRNEIMKKSVGLDYDKYEYDGIGFDYELLMSDHGYTIEDIRHIQKENRNKEHFLCLNCGFLGDGDIQASTNIGS